jgi:hypothetical protein
VRVGDLVKMDLSDYSAEEIIMYGDEWGFGIVVEVDHGPGGVAHVSWNKVGLSWEMQANLKVI